MKNKVFQEFSQKSLIFGSSKDGVFVTKNPKVFVTIKIKDFEVLTSGYESESGFATVLKDGCVNEVNKPPVSEGGPCRL